MRNIKQLFRLCYLSLLRFRLHYATGAVCRVSRRFIDIYHTVLSRAFYTLSRWECRYKNELRRYLAAKEKEGSYESQH